MTRKLWLVVAAVCLTAWTASAQVPTGTISGRVTDEKGGVMPGVTVTVTSPSLQGPRETVTSENGDYSIPLLPPGEYAVVFELMGFRPLKRSVSLGATQVLPLDAQLSIAEVTETVQVTADAGAFLETAQVATNIKQELMTTLPSTRTLVASVLMAPNVRPTGVTSTNGGDGALVVAGSMSFDSVYMINGVAITENLRGQPTTLFIEDAIQETTVSTGGISAEYGRFGGGLVNVITKSGGNDFSGSFRLSMNNDDWRAVGPFPGPKTDDTVPTYEYTFGGPILRDRLWFFNAGRFRELGESRQTQVTVIPFIRGENEKRYEGKLTYSLRNGQTVRGAYTHVDQIITNNSFQNVMDLKSLYNQEQPQRLLSLNYNGLVTNSLALEGQYSRRTLEFLTSGAAGRDLINDTLLIDRSRGGTGFRYWAPTFCTCNIDERSNYEFLLKGSYFLSTRGSGAHSIVFGYNHYNDQRSAENHQSGSDWRILGTGTTIQDGVIYPVFQNTGAGGTQTLIQNDPITLESRGSDIRTHALFINDAWRFNSGVSLNIGLRWDKNNGVDAAGTTIATGNRLSPRIGVAWDPLNDGRWSITGSFARYVSGLNNGITEQSPAGSPATYQWPYQGPDINVGGATTPTPQAIQQLFDWFNANGGTNRTPSSASIPGVNTFVGELNSPYSYEYGAGVSRTVGNRGSVRFDYIFRDYKDFYITRTDLTTGTATAPNGVVFDINLVENSSEDLKRRYQGGTIQATYRLLDGLNAGANYTLSRTWGNVDGENPASGPLTAQLYSYPEYRELEWNAPEGNLGSDQRHRARLWGTYRLPVTEAAGSIDVGLLHTFGSGIPFTSGGAPPQGGTGVTTINTIPFVTNPGYANPLSGSGGAVEYYFFERDQFRTEAQNRTDFSLNYSYRVPGGAELFFHGEVLNIFNVYQLCACGGTVFNNGGGSDMRQINTAVVVATPTNGLQTFNPFTETPVEGVHWRLGPTFGQATSRFAYTSPRTLRLNFGVRF